MHTLTSPAITDDAYAGPSAAATPWTALAGVAAALALVAWAGPDHGSAAGAEPALECRISHPPGASSVTTVMLVNASHDTLPAGTAWAWAPAGGDPQRGERHVLAEALAGGGAVRVLSDVPAVALRCRAAVLSAPAAPGAAAAPVGDDTSVAALTDGTLSTR